MAPQPNGQRLILLIDWDSHTIIKETRNNIFTGPSQGTVKVLRDPEAKLQKGEGAALESASLKTTTEDGADAPIPLSP
jgi:hypothetical protein